MNDAHLHLIVNHLPVLGTVFALLLGVYGLARRQPAGVRAALGALVLCGVGSFAAAQTGERAEEIVEHLPGISEVLIHEHEEAAEIATYASIALSVLALGALVWRRREPEVGTAPTVALLIGALVVSGLMARTATRGGEIRHTEIRSDGVAPIAPDRETERHELEREDREDD